MIILIDTLTSQGEERKFAFWTHTIEAGVEAVNNIVSTGDTLLRAYLIDKTGGMALPLETFDGQPISEGMTRLQQEWEEILGKPVN